MLCAAGQRHAHCSDARLGGRHHCAVGTQAIEQHPVNISAEQLKFIEDHGSSLLSETFYDWLVGRCAAVLLPLI